MWSGPSLPVPPFLQKLHDVLKRETHQKTGGLKAGERPDQPRRDLSELDYNYLWLVLFPETWNTFYRQSMFDAV